MNIVLEWPHVRGDRALLNVFVALVAFLALTITWAASRAQGENCASANWGIFVYKLQPNLYAKKCGCPNNLDSTFSCNLVYALVLGL